VAAEVLGDWLRRVDGEGGRCLRVAYNRDDSIPMTHRSSLTARRRFLHSELNLKVDAIRSKEDREIRDFIRWLVDHQDEPSSTQLQIVGYPVVEIGHGIDQWSRIDVPVLEKPVFPKKRIRLVREHSEWTFDDAGQITETLSETTIKAIDAPVYHSKGFFFWPGVMLHRLRLRVVGATFERLGWVGDNLLVEIRYDPPLKRYEERSRSIEVLIDGSSEPPGEPLNGYEYGNEYPIDELSLRMNFDPKKLPKTIWWFEGLPFGAAPGLATPSRMLYPTEDQPSMSRSLWNLGDGPTAVQATA
jgi:hypothetical protein